MKMKLRIIVLLLFVAFKGSAQDTPLRVETKDITNRLAFYVLIEVMDYGLFSIFWAIVTIVLLPISCIVLRSKDIIFSLWPEGSLYLSSGSSSSLGRNMGSTVLATMPNGKLPAFP